ncbi:MAG: DNA polymerase/3'-5' exonuclease PolX [Candidatus ainarchaeum sp.]|nr:DNA polymerase/3'-5' exonuclease PolX [Candidatus ainarchaeum sp.]
MKNREIAGVFFEIADLLDLQEVQWKPRVYRQAAIAIEALPNGIEEIWKQGRLEEIPGVGENIAKKIIEILETGKLKYLEELRKQFPIDIEALNKIPGLGPKKAMVLYKKLGIKNIAGLKKAALSGKISKVRGFGEKTQQEILKGIQQAQGEKKRILLWLALQEARQVKAFLENCSEALEVELAGSLRRRCETIGDIDILVSSKKPEKVMDFFVSMPNVKGVLAKGITKTSVLVENNLQIDLRVVSESQWGSALQYFTGSKQHSIDLRKIAQKKGLKLSEYGVFRAAKVIASKTEKDVYNSLGLDYIEPEMREAAGEIEAAQKHSLPCLVKYSEIRGDFHLHTNYSDGKNPVSEIVENAQNLGQSFCAITDHFGALKIAGSMDDRAMLKQISEIDVLQKKFPKLRIFKACEADIQPDGSIKRNPAVLKKLDFVCASVHSHFRLGKIEQTRRIVKAIENPLVKIIGHPTARKIGEREPIEIDFDAVFDAAKKNSVALEINATPERMDLNDVNARAAVKSGVALSIGTDSHLKEQMSFLELGTAIARRAWAEKKSILNSWPLPKIEKFFEK